jgi:2,3-bisphosphoglycerate-independent phosphoglycerate mutase
MGLEAPQAMTGVNLVPAHDWRGARRVLLIILDGWGLGQADPSNPIHLANTPVWDDLMTSRCPAKLYASGEAVGLQAGKAGNSEAGHLNIGAGRVVPQDDVRLDQALKDGSFDSNEVFLQAMDEVILRKRSLHLIGLLTEKSSHGSIDYPLALIKLAKEKGVQEVYLHVIFDGRSTEPGSAPALLAKVEAQMEAIGCGQIVTGIGRGIALDRDGNYSKIKKAFDALVLGAGHPFC